MKALLTRTAPDADPRVALAQMPDGVHITKAELAQLLDISTRQVDRLLVRGALPPPMPNLGPGTLRWNLGAVRRFLEAQAAASQ